MLTARIIPCLDVKDGRVVKGVRFQNLRDSGCPVERSAFYEAAGADELVLLDVSATVAGRETGLDVIRRVREQLSIPLTTGGGIRVADDAARALAAGADKISVNSAAVANPQFIDELARRFGCQCTILAVDAQRTEAGKWQVLVRSGGVQAGRDVVDWVQEATDRGAGEILLTSWDRDGTRQGYDLELLEAVSRTVSVPVIASGGASHPAHLLEALQHGADAVLAASMFHDGDFEIRETKEFLRQQGVAIRL